MSTRKSGWICQNDKSREPARTRAGILINLAELKTAGKKFGYGATGNNAGPTLLAFGDDFLP